MWRNVRVTYHVRPESEGFENVRAIRKATVYEDLAASVDSRDDFWKNFNLEMDDCVNLCV